MALGIGWSGGRPVLEGLAEVGIPLRVDVRTSSGHRSFAHFHAGRCEVGGVGVRVAAVEREGGLEVGLAVENRGGEPLALHTVEVALGEGVGPVARPERSRAWVNGFQSWTPSVSVPAGSIRPVPALRVFSLMTHHVDSPWFGRRDGLASTAVMVLQERGEPALLAGWLTHRVGHGEAFLRHRGAREWLLSGDYGGKELAPGEVIEGETLWLARGEVHGLLERWADLAGAAMGARRGPPVSPLGWCSWYEYYARVSEGAVRSNLAALREAPHLEVATVQLDDGYQAAVGDWLAINRKFPRGLEPLAREVREAGFQAGIWTAPFWAAGGSALRREHPEMLLRGQDRRPVYAGWNPVWMARLYALDLTHPATLEWLGHTFTALVEAGFDYHKIDFLFAGLRHGRRHDPGTSPVEAYRRGLAAIRDALGPERFLLGCGAPLGPSLGLVDAMRISQDVKETWDDALYRVLGAQASYPAARGAIRNVMTRAFFHGRWWINDPDCLLVRARDTRLDLEETRLLVTILGMSGGMLFLSDDLSRLSRERLALAEAVLPPTPLTGLAVDLMERTDPEHFALVGRTRRLDALVHWGRRPEIRPVPDCGEGTRFDFWAEDPEVGDEVAVPRHGVRALLFTPLRPTPHLVGTTLHLTALVDGRLEGTWEEGALVLRGRQTARREGRVWVRCPGGRAPAALPEGVEADGAWAHGVVLRLRTAPDEHGSWSLRLPFEPPGGGA